MQRAEIGPGLHNRGNIKFKSLKERTFGLKKSFGSDAPKPFHILLFIYFSFSLSIF